MPGRDRPRIGLVARSGTLRDGGWPVYGADAPTAHAILEAGGFPRLIPALPLLPGYDPLRMCQEDGHTFALFFDLLWPLMRDLDGLVLSGGGDLCACLLGQQAHPQAETPDAWRDVWERSLAAVPADAGHLPRDAAHECGAGRNDLPGFAHAVAQTEATLRGCATGPEAELAPPTGSAIRYRSRARIAGWRGR